MTEINIKLNNGREFTYSKEDAKEIYEELKEIFENDEDWFDSIFRWEYTSK